MIKERPRMAKEIMSFYARMEFGLPEKSPLPLRLLYKINKDWYLKIAYKIASHRMLWEFTDEYLDYLYSLDEDDN